MADSAEATAPAVEATPKKTPKTKKVVKKANHPPTAVMVNNAIKNLKERGGSSLQAIKKYVASHYKVDAEKLAPFIKKFLKTSVVSGTLVQTKGKGASGSFKLANSVVSKSSASSTTEKKPRPTTARTKAKAKASKAAAKKAAPKKEVVKPKKAAPKKVAAKPKSPAKAKKPAKAPAVKKPKSPKAKTARKAPGKAKKAAPKKK